jgi:hypothetical protein
MKAPDSIFPTRQIFHYHSLHGMYWGVWIKIFMNNRLEVQDCIMYDHNVHVVNRKPLHYLIHKWHFKILENQNKDK